MAKFEVPVLSRNLRIRTEEGHDHAVRITGVKIGVRTPPQSNSGGRGTTENMRGKDCGQI